ncbi:TraB/GumN family protein [Thalassovita aquimarina]|uniref:TraB/GumN family protein n=1 Tax=Thalassovita aquimarina TaxID=2785917 RepID=A0ABS5HXB8_9RHOB|nr:TraB/GumN family protein [Thalassovita aquimarina]
MLRLWLIITLTLFAYPLHAACDGESGFWSLPGEQQRALQQRADRVPFPEGILWQVEKNGVTSHIIGTMHLYDPRHADTLARLNPLLDRADQVFLEATGEQEAEFQRYLTANPDLILLTEGPSLIDLLGEDSWKRLQPQLKSRGIPGFVAAKYRPWFLGMNLAIPTCAIRDLKQKKKGLDRMVEIAAQERNLTIRSLDDVKAVFRLLAGDPLEKQVEELKWSLQFELTDAISGGSDLTDHYFRGQTQLGWEYLSAKAINHYGAKPEDRDKIVSLLNEMMEKLIVGRNHGWAETLSVELAQTDSFVAIGALHLPGENGVLALLERHGFTITRLPLSEG